MEIYDYLEMCATDESLRKIRNIAVVPLCSQERKHIRIDHDVFHCMLKDLKIDPKVKSAKTNKNMQMSLKDFIPNADKHWFEHFEKKKFKRMAKREKTFKFEIDTDGVSATILFVNTNRDRGKKSLTHIDEVAEKWSVGEFERECGIDLGYKNPIAGVIRDQNGEEVNFKVSCNQFRTSTGDKKRERIRKKLAADFEQRAEADRENREHYDETPSPKGRRWLSYIDHRLKFFNDAIDTYTVPK